MALDNGKRKYLRLWDLLVLFIVILVASLSVLFFVIKGKEGCLVAVIRVDGKVYSEVSLSELSEPYEVSVSVEDGEVMVRLSPDGAEVISSPCKDKLCVNTGKLSKSGQSAVCLSERVSVELVSDFEAGSSVDAVAG